MHRFWLTIAVAASGVLTLPASASAFYDGGLDPSVGQPLMTMLNMAGQQCQMGNQQGCMLVQQMQQVGNMLMQAQGACQQGDPQGCQVYQMGAQQILSLYQQVQFSQAPTNFNQAPPQFPPNGFDPNQSQFDHQQRMQTLQNGFEEQNRQWQQNQTQNEGSHQQFLETLRQ